MELPAPVARRRHPIAIGSLVSNPVVQDGVVYLQDIRCNVYAISLASGRLRWEYHVNQQERSGPGPNGVAVSDGVVYGLAPTAAFALNARSGKRIWVNRHLLTKKEGTFGIQPQVANGRVYIASQVGPDGGVLLALRASNGHLLWKFDTVPRVSVGVRELGLGAGGAWETPLVGRDGSVTYGIGNPFQSPDSAIAHPSRELYTDSDVNLTASSGKMRWYYHGVPNDWDDWDMQASPIAATVRHVPVVIGGGKMGIVYEMNARSGKLLWATPVGQHDGHDRDSLKALEHKSTLKAPYRLLPGYIGGILTDMAVAGNTVYVVTCDLGIRVTSLKRVLAGKLAGSPHGQVEALNLSTGRVEWSTTVDTLPLGAVTVSHNLVLTTLVTGHLLALSRASGAIVYRHQLPSSTNAPIAIAGNTILVPVGSPSEFSKVAAPQLVAYTVR